MAKAHAAAQHPVNNLEDSFNRSTFGDTVQAGLFTAGTDVAISLSTDGFEAWRQEGFQGWPVVATVLNLSSENRTRNVCQILITITPGPRQPHDFESVLHPVVEELNELARRIAGVKAFGLPGVHTLRARALPFTTDMPAGDKLLNAFGHNGYQPNRFRAFQGVFHPPANHTYYPPTHPETGEVLFSVEGCTAPKRTAESIRDGAALLAAALADGKPISYQNSLAKQTGVEGFSLFFPRILSIALLSRTCNMSGI